MKRLALSLAVLCLVAALPVPGHARSELLPALAGHNVVVGTGPSAVVVRLDQEARVDFTTSTDGAGWFDGYKTKSSWAAILIQELTPHRYGQHLFHIRLFADGCKRKDRCLGDEWAGWSVHGNGDADDLPDMMTLEKGTYRVYVLTDPGTRVEAAFHVSGLPGRAHLRATTPVSAEFASDETSFAYGGHLTGKFTGNVGGPGIMIAGHWRTQMNAGWSLDCIEKGRADIDPLNTCGIPPAYERRAAGATGHMLWAKRKGTWSYAYRVWTAGEQAEGRIRAYALFLTFL